MSSQVFTLFATAVPLRVQLVGIAGEQEGSFSPAILMKLLAAIGLCSMKPSLRAGPSHAPGKRFWPPETEGPELPLKCHFAGRCCAAATRATVGISRVAREANA
jgi:hypothetical protein